MARGRALRYRECVSGVARAGALTAFVAVVLLGWAGAHAYLAVRLVLDLDLSPGAEWAALAALALLAVAVPLEQVAQHAFGPRRLRPLAWATATWMGLAFLAVLLLALSDGVLGLAGAALRGGGSPVATARIRAAFVVAGALAVGLTALSEARRQPEIRRWEIALARWPAALDGFRIVQVSDVHIGPLLDRRFAEWIADRVAALAPDLIAVTGDLVDGSLRWLRDEVEPLARLRAPHGVFFVTGNHDFYSGVDAWLGRVRELGMRPLRNERVTIERAGAAFELAGVNDHNGRFFGPGNAEDLGAALEGWDAERPLILLAHDPTTFHEASRRGVDLQISGHTHGGQIWPFGAVVRLFVGFVAGRYRRGRSELLVTRGAGFWGPPMRLRAPAEIAEIVLRAQPSGKTRSEGRTSCEAKTPPVT